MFLRRVLKTAKMKIGLIACLFIVNIIVITAQDTKNADGKADEKKADKLEQTDEYRLSIITASDESSFYGKIPGLKVNFEKGESVIVPIAVTNTTNKKVVITRWNYFRPFLPQLEKDGKLISYVDSMKNEIEKNLSEPPFRAKGNSVVLLASETQSIEILNLAEWYGQLESGIYNLKIFYRSKDSKKLVESNTIVFEIKPEKTAMLR